MGLYYSARRRLVGPHESNNLMGLAIDFSMNELPVSPSVLVLVGNSVFPNRASKFTVTAGARGGVISHHAYASNYHINNNNNEQELMWSRPTNSISEYKCHTSN